MENTAGVPSTTRCQSSGPGLIHLPAPGLLCLRDISWDIFSGSWGTMWALSRVCAGPSQQHPQPGVNSAQPPEDSQQELLLPWIPWPVWGQGWDPSPHPRPCPGMCQAGMGGTGTPGTALGRGSRCPKGLGVSPCWGGTRGALTPSPAGPAGSSAGPAGARATSQGRGWAGIPFSCPSWVTYSSSGPGTPNQLRVCPSAPQPNSCSLLSPKRTRGQVLTLQCLIL